MLKKGHKMYSRLGLGTFCVDKIAQDVLALRSRYVLLRILINIQAILFSRMYSGLGKGTF